MQRICFIVPQASIFESERRKKRSINGKPLNLYIKYLVVLESTVFAKYKALYNQLNNDLVMQYLKIHFYQLINGVFK